MNPVDDAHNEWLRVTKINYSMIVSLPVIRTLARMQYIKHSGIEYPSGKHWEDYKAVFIQEYFDFDRLYGIRVDGPEKR